MTTSAVDLTVIARVPDQPWCDLGTEVVVLRLRDSAYYRFPATGRSIWLLLEEPRTFDQLIAGLTQEYDAAPEAIMGEVRPFLAQCAELGLLTMAGPGA
jgi:hypothetical protein